MIVASLLRPTGSRGATALRLRPGDDRVVARLQLAFVLWGGLDDLAGQLRQDPGGPADDREQQEHRQRQRPPAGTPWQAAVQPELHGAHQDRDEEAAASGSRTIFRLCSSQTVAAAPTTTSTPLRNRPPVALDEVTVPGEMQRWRPVEGDFREPGADFLQPPGRRFAGLADPNGRRRP